MQTTHISLVISNTKIPLTLLIHSKRATNINAQCRCQSIPCKDVHSSISLTPNSKRPTVVVQTMSLSQTRSELHSGILAGKSARASESDLIFPSLTTKTDPDNSTELRKQCLQWMKDMGVSVSTPEGGVHVNILRAIGGKSGHSEQAAESNTSSTTNDSGAAQISINTESSMSTSVSDKSSQSPSPISGEDAKERDPPNMSKGKPTTKEQFAFKDKSVSDGWPDLTQTALKDEMDTNTFLLRCLQHWKDMLAAKKHSSPDNEDEQDLPSDILDFNGSMLSREDYDDLRASATTKKRPVKLQPPPRTSLIIRASHSN